MSKKDNDNKDTGIPEPAIQAGQTETTLQHDHELLAPDPNAESMKTKLEESEKKIADLNQQVLRAHAELQNIQRRAEREVANAHRFALERFLNELLPVVDSLEQAVAALAHGDNKSFGQGVELTLKMMQETLKRFGIEAINPVGQPFDPSFHEAMSCQENQEVAANTVLSVFQKGYLLNGRLIRPARVLVSKREEEVQHS